MLGGGEFAQLQGLRHFTGLFTFFSIHIIDCFECRYLGVPTKVFTDGQYAVGQRGG